MKPYITRLEAYSPTREIHPDRVYVFGFESCMPLQEALNRANVVERLANVCEGHSSSLLLQRTFETLEQHAKFKHYFFPNTFEDFGGVCESLVLCPVKNDLKDSLQLLSCHPQVCFSDVWLITVNRHQNVWDKMYLKSFCFHLLHTCLQPLGPLWSQVCHCPMSRTCACERRDRPHRFYHSYNHRDRYKKK